MGDNALAVRNGNGEAGLAMAESVALVLQQTIAIQQCMEAVMKRDEHFGVIPGTTGKPTLLQPGADKLITLFWLTPEFTTTERTLRDDLIMYEVKCSLKHRRTGETWGEGVGACNSREKKYLSQTVQKLCPKCGKPAIIKGKEEYGGGWLCFKKKDGCGAKFDIKDESITQQDGATKTEAVHDLQNTIFKMACKRAKVAAVLTATAASDLFTQDLEDLADQVPVAPVVSTTGATRDGRFAVEEDEVTPVDDGSLEKVPIYDVSTGEQVGWEPKATDAQTAELHRLQGVLRNNLAPATFRKRLIKTFSKESIDLLSTREAAKVIESLLKAEAKQQARLETAGEGTQPTAPLSSAPPYDNAPEPGSEG